MSFIYKNGFSGLLLRFLFGRRILIVCWSDSYYWDFEKSRG